MPCLASLDRIEVAASRSSISAVSVTSISSRCGSRPDVARASLTIAATSALRKSRAETLTETEISLRPVAAFGGGRGQHPAADVGDEPGFLGDRDEQRRRDRAEFGVVPARQRLAAHHAPRLQIDDRLVDQRQRAVGDGLLEIGLQTLPVAVVGIHLVVEHLSLLLAVGLGLVEREVGLVIRSSSIVGRLGGDDDADR